MHTQCPDCKTRFRVNDEQLRIAHGQVRCSRCHVIFNALETLKTGEDDSELEFQAESTLDEFEELRTQIIDDDSCPFEDSDLEDLDSEQEIKQETPTETLTPEAEPDNVVDDELSEVLRELEKLELGVDQKSEPAPVCEALLETKTDKAPELETEPDIAAEPEPLPDQSPKIHPPDNVDHPPQMGVKDQLMMEEILGRQQQEKKTGGAWWAIGIITLLILSLSQLAWFGRERLMHFPEGRMLLQTACQHLGCKLPVVRAPEKIQVLSRSITSHPKIEDALLIQLTIANKADFSQPYPMLQISLFSSEEQLVVQRRFQPNEYLHNPDRDGQLDPGRARYVELEIEDPGNDVTGFKLEFF